jgi:hypothetical protein
VQLLNELAIGNKVNSGSKSNDHAAHEGRECIGFETVGEQTREVEGA